MFKPLCVVQRRGTIENLHYRLSGLRRDVSTVGARILEEIVGVDKYIRAKMRDHLPRTFGVTDHILMELTGSRTVRVSHIQTSTSVVGGNLPQQSVTSLGEDTPNRQADVEIYINMPNKSNVRLSESPCARVCDVKLMINDVTGIDMRDIYLVYASKVLDDNLTI